MRTRRERMPERGFDREMGFVLLAGWLVALAVTFV
jgi:hypothetical protein